MPDQVAGLLGPYGWTETDQVGPAEYRARYLAGRDDLSEIEPFVHATKD